MHDIDDDHVHADGDPAALEPSHPLWRTDRIALRSVGIDIGSSTSHLIFSTLELRRQSAVLSSRYELAGRHIDYQSPILLTPFVAGVALDVPRLSAFIDGSYAQAGATRADIDTGAVITTGDAARKDNAAAVVEMVAALAGTLVCASAGPLLEAKMAAYGSGAVGRSAQGEAEITVLNIDIGGGTSKLAIVRGGRVVEATAINVGARLVTFDDDERLTKIEPAAAVVARHRALPLAPGAPLRAKSRLDLAAALVDALLEVASRRPLSPLAQELMIAAPFADAGAIDTVMISGGVSEYFYQRTTAAFGDIGPELARLMRQRLPKALPDATVEPSVEGIRATVIGASQFTAQVSGNTLFIGNPRLLPLRNVPVVMVEGGAVAVARSEIAAMIGRLLAAADVPEGQAAVLAVRWPHGPAYGALAALAGGIADATAAQRAQGLPVIVMLDIDVARLLGAIVAETTGHADILCIDGVDLQEFDYVDIGVPQPDSGVVTVVVKSLIFTG